MSFLNNLKALLPLLIGFILPYGLTAQEHKIYSVFDEIVGESNLGLFNGVEYIEKHRNINENHKFFLSREFIEGNIIYEGQPYFSQFLSYNIFDKVLLIKAKEGREESIFQLINDKIDSFEIKGQKFINVKPGISQSVQGFYEVLLENDEVQVLKKHSRYMNQLRNKRFIHYEFKPEKNNYQVNYKGEYYEIGSRRDVIRMFPDLRREIHDIYSLESALRKSNPDKFIISLFTKLSPSIQKETGTAL